MAAPTEWTKEGISPEVMKAYGIRIDSALLKIIIPHRNINGELIGIRGRAYNPIELDDGKKYMPVRIQKNLNRQRKQLLTQNNYCRHYEERTVKLTQNFFHSFLHISHCFFHNTPI